VKKIVLVVFVCAAGATVIAAAVLVGGRYPRTFVVSGDAPTTVPPLPPPIVDTVAYNAKMLAIANLPPQHCVTSTVVVTTTVAMATGTAAAGVAPTATAKIATTTKTVVKCPPAPPWPVHAAYPDAGAILPFKRIVAYYGNFYSTQMGVLGEYPPDQVLAMLASTTAEWAAADPTTPVIPAVDYIAVAAQSSPGPDGMYRLRMPPDQVEKAIGMADQVNGLVFLDVQVGLSNVETEVPLLADYLKLPNVELSIDPEFAMHNGERPGTVIGTLTAADINFAAQFLAKIVRENHLPPKILVVHRFTQAMVTNASEIRPLPEVQIVMDMDGFGPPAQKLTTYHDFIQSEPVQFTGFKLFYKNDVVVGGRLMTPTELLRLSPQPSYIQYQ
jgi:hypothetical protein